MMLAHLRLGHHFVLPYLGPGLVLVKTGIFFPSFEAPELNVKQLPYLQFHVCFQ